MPSSLLSLCLARSLARSRVLSLLALDSLLRSFTQTAMPCAIGCVHCCSRACILPFIGWVLVRVNIQRPEGTPRHVGAGDQGQEQQQQYERNDDARNHGLCVGHEL